MKFEQVVAQLCQINPFTPKLETVLQSPRMSKISDFFPRNLLGIKFWIKWDLGYENWLSGSGVIFSLYFSFKKELIWCNSISQNSPIIPTKKSKNNPFFRHEKWNISGTAPPNLKSKPILKSLYEAHSCELYIEKVKIVVLLAYHLSLHLNY